MLCAMTENRRPASPARTTLTISWVLAIGWLVFAGGGGAMSAPALILLGFLSFVGAIVCLIVGLILRSKEKAAAEAARPPAQ